MTAHPCRHCPRTFPTASGLHHHTGSHRIAVRIEQAIAYGHSDGWIRDTLHADDEDIAEARWRIEIANKETG